MKTFIRIVMLLGLGAAELRAQFVIPPETNLFGDGFVQSVPRENQVRIVSPSRDGKDKAASGFEHILLFRDGRQVRGTVESLTRGEIVLRRPDADVPLHFSRGDVARLILSAKSYGSIGNSISEFDGPIPILEFGQRSRPAKKTPPNATIQLAGGDWLFGGMESPDGESFVMTLGKFGQVSIPRSAATWIHFGKRAAPALVLPGSAVSGQTLVKGTGTSLLQVGDRAIPGVGWIGHRIQGAGRIEVALECTEETEKALSLWLQPHSPSVNSYSTGTVVLEFGANEITRTFYAGGFQHESRKIPEEARKQGAPRYRIFHDAAERRVIVFRNDVLVADWVPDEKAKKEFEDDGGRRITNGLAVSWSGYRRSTSRSIDLKKAEFTSIRVQPWDGLVPGGESANAEDRLGIPGIAAFFGRLGKVTAERVTFAGKESDRVEGMNVRMPVPPPPLSEADVLLSFGPNGVLSGANCEIRDGKVRCRTSFSDGFELDQGALQFIGFPEGAPAAKGAPPPQRLVFGCGDELPGSVIAVDDASVRWKMRDGAEVVFRKTNVAGIRTETTTFAHTKDDAAAGTNSQLELRNGDRLKGDLERMEGGSLRWRHRELGPQEIKTDLVKSLVMSASPEWETARPSQSAASRYRESISDPWVKLDGSFAVRPVAEGNYNSRELLLEPKGMDRLEARFEVATTGQFLPTFRVTVAADDSESANIQFSSSQMYISYSRRRAGANFQNIEIQNQLGRCTTRLPVRMFLDRKAGRMWLFVNNVLIAEIGKQTSDRMPGLGKSIRIGASSGMSGSVEVISNPAILEWGGEDPIEAARGSARTVLKNGDSTAAIPAAALDGKFKVETEIGALELPADQIQRIDFGHAAESTKAAVRVRLEDGSIVHLNEFRWADDRLRGKSATFGEVDLPAAACRELVLAPAPIRFPQPLMKKAPPPSKEEIEKEAAEAKEAEAAEQRDLMLEAFGQALKQLFNVEDK